MDRDGVFVKENMEGADGSCQVKLRETPVEGMSEVREGRVRVSLGGKKTRDEGDIFKPGNRGVRLGDRKACQGEGIALCGRLCISLSLAAAWANVPNGHDCWLATVSM